MIIDPDKLVIEQFKLGVHSFYYDEAYICDITYQQMGKIRTWYIDFYDKTKNAILGKKRYSSYKTAKMDLIENILPKLI